MILDVKTKLYVAFACSAAVVSLAIVWIGGPGLPVGPLLLFGVLAFLSETLAVDVPLSADFSVAFSVYVAALVLFGPALASLTALVGALDWTAVLRKTSSIKVAFNAAELVLSVNCAALAYRAAGGQYGVQWQFPEAVFPMLGASVTFLLVNTFLVAGVVALSEGKGLLDVLRVNFTPYVTNFLALVVLAVILVKTYITAGSAGVLLLIAPLLVARQTFQVYVKLRQAYQSTVQSLVAAIEAKDAYTRGHSERVADYSEMIARQLHMSDEAIDKLRIAALLHDLGKIGIQRSILSKTGRLTDEEFGLMREHPELATAILHDVDFLDDIIPTIYHHHEHYDGSGYVKKLKGEQIPLTARILAVADAYDAMISVRPYRPALEPQTAAAELVSCAGSQFDRKAVDALLAATGIQPQLDAEIGIAEGQLRFVDDTSQ